MKCEYCKTDFVGVDENTLTWVPHGNSIKLSCTSCMPTPSAAFSLDSGDFAQQTKNKLWWPAPRAVGRMPRTTVVSELRKFRNAWQRITKVNQGLENDYLKKEPVGILRTRLARYYSDASYKNSLDWPSAVCAPVRTPARKRTTGGPRKSKKKSKKRPGLSKKRKRVSGKSKAKPKKKSRKRKAA